MSTQGALAIAARGHAVEVWLPVHVVVQDLVLVVAVDAVVVEDAEEEEDAVVAEVVDVVVSYLFSQTRQSRLDFMLTLHRRWWWLLSSSAKA